MYLVSWIEEQGKVEASLGGRVTVEEMHVFAEELREVVATFEARPYVLTIDHSKAKPFDLPTQRMLSNLKDECLLGSAEKIVSVVEDEDEMTVLTNERIMPILMGQERIVMAAVDAEWLGAEPIEVPIDIRKAA
jgi:hypothetical protein